MKGSKTAQAARVRRHERVRRRLEGTPERPRLCVYRSLSHIYAQVIDDVIGKTIAAASDLEKEVRGERDGKSKSDLAKTVGVLIGKRAAEKGITEVVFDRGGYKYHGRVKVLAEAAREAGLRF